MSISNHWLLRKNHGWHRNSHNFESGVAKNVDFISIFLHQINKNRLEINNFGGAHGKNLDLRVHTVGAHGRGRLKSIDLAVCTLKSIKIAQINKNERNQQFWCDQMKRPLV